MRFTRSLLQSIDLSIWFCLALWVGSLRSAPAQGKEPLRKDLQGPLFTQASKCSSQEVMQESLLQGTTGLTVPGRSGCKSVWDLTGALLASAPPLHIPPNYDPGLLGEGFGCGFLNTAKGYSNENCFTGKEEHCMDFQAVVWTTASKLHRENQALSVSMFGTQLHRQGCLHRKQERSWQSEVH